MSQTCSICDRCDEMALLGSTVKTVHGNNFLSLVGLNSGSFLYNLSAHDGFLFSHHALVLSSHVIGIVHLCFQILFLHTQKLLFFKFTINFQCKD